MKTESCDLLIIGAGAAGMAAALQAAQEGIEHILLIDQGPEAGGILEQCIHNGFGLHTFKEELTGPAFSQKGQDLLKEYPQIEFRPNCTCLQLDPLILQDEQGKTHLDAKAVILAQGCRERPAGALDIRGTRPAGIFTAGQAQKLINMHGIVPGKNVLILGSGDIGLIMARRMTLSGAHVIGVAELMPYSNGLVRNIKQCLEDYDIPLWLSRTVTKVSGKDRLESVTLQEVGPDLKPIAGTETVISCDTLLLSVGLIPDMALAKQAGLPISPRTKSIEVNEWRMSERPGLFAAGNALHVHDLADYAWQEGKIAGKGAADWIKGKTEQAQISRRQIPGKDIGYVVPQRIEGNGPVTCMFRVRKPASNVRIRISSGDWSRTIKKARVLPAEMEQVVLTANDLQACPGDILWEIIND
jgi:NADPH-dependent 2,4-dienoyl-CoA reductase/sulfur reductase-like enzyme